MRRLTVAALSVAGLLVAGCGTGVLGDAIAAEEYECPAGTEGCDPIQPVGPGGDLTVEAGNFWFEVTGGVPVTGDIDVTLVNTSDAFHDFAALGAADGSEIVGADPATENTGVVKLFPGEWTVICTVPGHRQAGMEFQLTVYADEDEAAEAEEAGELPSQVSQREG